MTSTEIILYAIGISCAGGFLVSHFSHKWTMSEGWRKREKNSCKRKYFML